MQLKTIFILATAVAAVPVDLRETLQEELPEDVTMDKRGEARPYGDDSIDSTTMKPFRQSATNDMNRPYGEDGIDDPEWLAQRQKEREGHWKPYGDDSIDSTTMKPFRPSSTNDMNRPYGEDGIDDPEWLAQRQKEREGHWKPYGDDSIDSTTMKPFRPFGNDTQRPNDEDVSESNAGSDAGSKNSSPDYSSLELQEEPLCVNCQEDFEAEDSWVPGKDMGIKAPDFSEESSFGSDETEMKPGQFPEMPSDDDLP